MSFGGLSLAASTAAMQQMDATSAAMTTMKSEFDQKKLVADTMNAIAAGSMDTATKAITAMGEASKNIRF
ncbi:ATP-dependent helicase HrpA [Pseudomonas thivervalensis]|uniref:Type III secretion apparatus protein RspA n=4 Tax=Pseudomonas TaxID=286 RepID=J2MDD0_PSEFQ|nr:MULTISPECIES: type III secretion apparatus protein RspA [Pseudomonas]AEV65558.1 HrpA, rspA [Pseudomonas ogarae]AMZ73802.1 type III secretion apparatus protein RspA [Pseudomonas fluorescens]AUO49341.1 type III secretion apparatus protein RspA [Pseudomonas ogarae]AXA57828.1 type III secretion apparatus protein RspA [Pseudomonas thivervalensis]AXA63540.1 type III secretion apparatus protein RspA [Pseudomonas thivervalensis]